MMSVHRIAAVSQPQQRARRSEPVSVIKVREDVWQEALRLADGDPRRIRILGEQAVEILARPLAGD